MSASKKVATVFAKRIAQSAIPSKCKTCECTAHNTGVSYMECSPCSYPTRATIDYVSAFSVYEINEKPLSLIFCILPLPSCKMLFGQPLGG